MRPGRSRTSASLSPAAPTAPVAPGAGPPVSSSGLPAIAAADTTSTPSQYGSCTASLGLVRRRAARFSSAAS